MKYRTMAVVLLFAAAAGIGGWRYYEYVERYPSTSGAYVGMHLVRIASQVSGPINRKLRLDRPRSFRAGGECAGWPGRWIKSSSTACSRASPELP